LWCCGFRYGFVVFSDRQAADTVKKAPQEELFLLGKSVRRLFEWFMFPPLTDLVQMNVGDAFRKADTGGGPIALPTGPAGVPPGPGAYGGAGMMQVCRAMFSI
jgi:hypothetical protein